MSPASYHHKKSNGWPIIRLVDVRGMKRWMVDTRQSVKGRSMGRRFFHPEQKEALKQAEELREIKALSGIAVHGALPGVMTEPERIDALEALNILRPIRCSLFEAAQLARDYLQRRRVYHKAPIIKKAWESYIEHKAAELERGEFRKKSLSSLKSTGRRLILPAWGTRRIESVQTPEIQAWVNTILSSANTRRDAKTVFGQLMNFARAQGWRQDNPVEPVTVKVVAGEPTALTPDQTKALLQACRAHPEAASLVPYFAVCTVAGLRPGEAEQLDWKDVHLNEGQLKVLPETSKIKQSRYVNLEPEAVALLKPYACKAGRIIGDVSISKWTQIWQDARGAAGWRFAGRSINMKKGQNWPDDVLRHTFATYWLARHNDVMRLCADMGNSPRVVGKHYRRAVPKGEVAAFWKIVGS